jgi:uncharacterized RDD family membrane protein YckC
MTALPDPDYQPQFYASVPSKRLVAWVADSILIFGMCVIAVPLTAFVGLLVWPLMYLVLGFAYRTVTIANGGGTWGMRFAGVEIRTADGSRPDLGMAALHTAGYSLSMAIPIVQVVSVILMLTSAKGQGLTDAFLGTAVINRRN